MHPAAVTANLRCWGLVLVDEQFGSEHAATALLSSITWRWAQDVGAMVGYHAKRRRLRR